MKIHYAKSKLSAFRKPLRECGLSPCLNWMIEGGHSLEGGGGIVSMEQLLACKERPTALMCSNDMTAIGVLHKLYRVNLLVPDDF